MGRIGAVIVIGTCFSTALAERPAPAGDDAAWLDKARAAIERSEYHFTPRPDGRLSAPNRAQEFRTTVLEDRIEVTPRSESAKSWRLSLRASAWGRADALETLPPGAAGYDEDRLTIARRALTEIWINDTRGLEQLFEIPAPPHGDRETGPLVVAMELSGDVLASTDADGVSVIFRDGTGGAVAHFTHLVVSDAGGREVPARFRLSPGALAIEIDDRDAVYPILVDPLLSSPSWTTESNQAGAFYGLSVAPAGDVNGDGFSDVLIGAQRYDNGQADEGRVYLYLGGASGLSTSAARTFESNQADARFGWSIATAGDLNEDGFDDFAVGAQLWDNGQADEGAVFVYTGAATAASIALAATLEANQADARLGYSLAYAGDIDGDGDTEIVAGAPQWDGGSGNEGAMFVFFGDPTTVIAAVPPYRAESNQADALFGYGVAGGVDVNADGYSDVFAGAPDWDSSSLTDAGMFAEFWGSATGFAASWNGSSEGPGGAFGQTIAAVGDTNGDGYADVVVGAPVFTNTFSSEGRIALFRGSSAGGLNVSPTSIRYGGANGVNLGDSLGAAGDVNGDGFADFAAGGGGADPGGVSNAGEIRVWHGSASGIAANADWVYAGTLTNSGIGEAVFTAGDVNGDGYSDLIVGEGGYDESGQTDEGRAHVFLGSGNGLVTAVSRTLQGDVAETGAFGTSVASAGDVNGDGFSDVIVGDPAYSPADAGAFFIFLGTASGPATAFTSFVEGPQFHAAFGASVAGAGDVNGDGYDDVIVGAPVFDVDPDDRAGRVFVYHGGASGVDGTADRTIDGFIDQNLGTTVAGVGDVNGDGFADIGVSGNIGDGTEVYYGSATGVQLSPVEFLDGEAVEAAGDVNGDGLSDVITNLFSSLSQDESYVYLGGSPVMDSGADWFKSASFDSAVHPAGDVNGDGYDDVVHRFFGQTTSGSNLHLGGPSGPAATGTPLPFSPLRARFGGDVNGDGFADILVHPGGEAMELYLGSASGYAATPAWDVSTPSAGNGYGASFAGAGDVNGDGFADVIVGADGGTGGGSAYVYFGGGGDGLDFVPHHFRGDNSGPAAFLGSSGSSDRFRIISRGRSARGRAIVAKDHQVAAVGSLVRNAPVTVGGWFDTGTTDSSGAGINFNRTVSGLSPETHYKWRMRYRAKDPIFPRTRWISMPGNGSEIKDIKTACASSTWYRDVDGDGFGNPAVNQAACAQPAGYVLPSGDCNDADPAMFPGNPEVCDGKDNNCNGSIDDGFTAPAVRPVVGGFTETGGLASFGWAAVPGADRYDVIAGDLNALRTSGGNFATATAACLKDDLPSLLYAEQAGTGSRPLWYLVRAVACTAAGSYDTTAVTQAGSRDAEIAASGEACP